MVRQGGTVFTHGQFFQQLLDELKQVIHLLELATRILVELAVAREDVQRFEQLDGLAGAQVELRTWVLMFGRGGVFVFGHGLIVQACRNA